MAARVIEQEVLEVLSGCEVEGNVVRIRHQLDRSLYERVDKVLKALGGRWDGTKAVRGHVFTRCPADVIDDACLTGTYEKWTVGGWFPTPPLVAAVLVQAAELAPGMLVLEPSAGRGALAQAAAAIVGRDNVACVEIRPEHAEKLRRFGFDVTERDFLRTSSLPRPIHDRVLMNPPFERLADCEHVRHAYGFLKRGGRLVSVMSPGWRFRQDWIAEDFRGWLSKMGASEGLRWTWTELPEGSFKPSGTMVSTGYLVIDRGTA